MYLVFFFLLDGDTITDFVLFIFYYLNTEFVLIFLILLLLFNKPYFLKYGFYEILFFLQLAILCYIL